LSYSWLHICHYTCGGEGHRHDQQQPPNHAGYPIEPPLGHPALVTELAY
jgi:hypothetical protein